MQRSLWWGLCVLCCFNSACLVPSSRFNDLQTHTEQLEWQLERENARNRSLQEYIDAVLEGNKQVQHPLIYRNPIPMDAYAWGSERTDRVYNPYFLSSSGQRVPIEIPIDLRVRHHGNNVVIALDNRILFVKGSIELLPQGKTALKKLAETLMNRKEYMIKVEGHATRSEAWDHPQWKDSWTLSVMRAVEVVRQLAAAGVPSDHLIPSGRGEYYPLQTSADSSLNAQNQRVEIYLSPVSLKP